MILNRQGVGRYALSVGCGIRTFRIEGVPRLCHFHVGHGDYALGVEGVCKNEVNLDPICAEVYKKGWSLSLIKMYLDSEVVPYVDWERIPIKKGWDGSNGSYLIAPAPSDDRSKYRTPWAIWVHLADNGHISIEVRAPDIYQDEVQLETLLAAIRMLPRPSELKHVHPCMLASCSRV